MNKSEHIQAAIDSMVEIPSTTRVKGWSFKYMDNFYVVLNFWMAPYGNNIGVYPANRKGKKLDAREIVLLTYCEDPIKGIHALADFFDKKED